MARPSLVPDQGYKSPTAFRLRTTLLEPYARVLAAMQRIMTQGVRTGAPSPATD
jgi:hypothetical protein